MFTFYLNLNIQNFFTSHGGHLPNITLKVPGVGFSVASLDCAKFGFIDFKVFRLLLS